MPTKFNKNDFYVLQFHLPRGGEHRLAWWGRSRYPAVQRRETKRWESAGDLVPVHIGLVYIQVFNDDNNHHDHHHNDHDQDDVLVVWQEQSRLQGKHTEGAQEIERRGGHPGT